ncbi:hypothetical protein [Nocardia sp. NPDC051570]|uniref:hypothetical protein n=1 Tax=Nocardia sp. NPDC051570 TaxID=3364324 RepID=UPI0037B2AAE8
MTFELAWADDQEHPYTSTEEPTPMSITSPHSPAPHVHRFAAHPLTGNVICRCGMTEVAAEDLHPDYVTVCCGCSIGVRGERPITPESRVYCFACDRLNRPVIHRDRWQDAVCAACGRTSAEAGEPGSWTFHWRTAQSASLSAQSCGGECADRVEAGRDDAGVLRRIPLSVGGRVKRPSRRTCHQPAA